MDQTLHLFGRRRRHADGDDDESKKSSIWNSEVYRDKKELEKRQTAFAKAQRADTEKPTTKTKKTLDKAERALQAQRDKIKTLSKDPMNEGDVAQVGEATKDNVAYMNMEKTKETIEKHHDDEKVLELHKSHLDLTAVWENDEDREILMGIIDQFGLNKNLKTTYLEINQGHP